VRVPLFQIDAFADELFQGNPAAVMPLGQWPADRLLQQVAAENNLSETAFLVSELPAEATVPERGCPAYWLRWFTPSIEVDLCGHATLATAAHLFEDVHPDAGRLQFWTRSGWLFVTREADRSITLDFPSVPVHPVEVDPSVSGALGVPVVQAWQGGGDLVYLLDGAETVRRLAPDLQILSALPVRGVVVTSAGDGTGADFVSRFFGALAGVGEDPVTGSAHCLLAPLWAERLGTTSLTARQLSARGGTLHCRVTEDRVLLSGRYRRYLEGWASIPAS
jgi:PhzF family phenazine biosynthesis protein